MGFIEDFLADRIAESDGAQSTATLVRRRKIAERLLGSPGAAAFEEQLESLEGLLDPSEIRQMRVEFMLRQYVNHPYASSWRPSPEHMDG